MCFIHQALYCPAANPAAGRPTHPLWKILRPQQNPQSNPTTQDLVNHDYRPLGALLPAVGAILVDVAGLVGYPGVVALDKFLIGVFEARFLVLTMRRSSPGHNVFGQGQPSLRSFRRLGVFRQWHRILSRQATMSTSSVSGLRSTLPLSVRSPAAASASFCVYAPSLSCLHLGGQCQQAGHFVHSGQSNILKYVPPLVWLAAAVGNECRISVEPFGTFYAVVSAKSREILRGLGFLEVSQMFLRSEVVLYLIEVSCFAPCFGDSSLVRNTHDEFSVCLFASFDETDSANFCWSGALGRSRKSTCKRELEKSEY